MIFFFEGLATTLAKSGARGRNRTADTMIFSHVLYQLSDPGIAAATVIEMTGERLGDGAYGEGSAAWQEQESPFFEFHSSRAISSGSAGGPGRA